MEALKDKLKINETFTKPIKKAKYFTKISDVVTQIEDFNFMADLLHLPTTKDGYKYLLVVIDLATNEFDIEPLKTKQSKETLNALKAIFKRKILKQPRASIRTDGGTEFKNEFHEFLRKNKIFHSVSLPYRHTQLSSVESLNKQLGFLFNHYMNAKEVETKKIYTNWTDIIEIVRTDLNKIRRKKAPYTEKTIFDYVDKPVNLNKENKFKIGDIVHYALDYPENALGIKQPTPNFRVADYRWSPIPKKIKRILYYSGAVPYRYMLDHMPNVSFTEAQLMKSKDDVDKYEIRQIIGKKVINKKLHYLVHWKGYLKKDATYEPATNLIKDGLQNEIDDYENNVKNKMKKIN